MLEGEISFERGLITQKFDFAPAYTYPKAGINQNIVAVVTHYEFNKLRLGGTLAVPVFGKKPQYLFFSAYSTQLWFDDKTWLGANYKSQLIASREAVREVSPETFTGPMFSDTRIYDRLGHLLTLGAGYKMVTRKHFSVKLGMYYTTGEQELYRFNHQWYENGVLQHENAWIHTAAHWSYSLQLGIPLLKGKRRQHKPQVTRQEVQVEPPVRQEPETAREEEQITSEPEVESTPDDANTSMPTKAYLPNNVVFLLDVSASMLQNQKMEKVKTAMLFMTDSLRTFDQVGVVTYNNKAEVLLQPQRADSTRRKDIQQTIQTITPKGSTNGVAGLESAYALALEHFIQSGNNQVILVTDGEFNEDQDDQTFQDLLANFKNDHIQLTIVGMGKTRSAQRRLKAMARKAQGAYIPLDDESDFRGLFLEIIKENSRIAHQDE